LRREVAGNRQGFADIPLLRLRCSGWIRRHFAHSHRQTVGPPRVRRA